MTTWSPQRRAKIVTALNSRGRVTEIEGNRWQLRLAGASAVSVGVAWDGDWLRLVRVIEVNRPAFWQALSLQQALAPTIKLALGSSAELQAIADVAVATEIDLAARIDEACTGLLDAGEVRADAAAAADVIDDAPLPEALRQLCSSSGFKVTNRSAGRVAVDLDVHREFAQAIVEHHRGMAIVSAPLTDETEIDSEVCRQALGLMLLRLNAHVCLVRGIAGPGARSPRLEVRLANPCGTEVERIFGALSVAWSLVGREAPLLGTDENLAHLFLRHSRAAGSAARGDENQQQDH
jgi:hypothetical protein